MVSTAYDRLGEDGGRPTETTNEPPNHRQVLHPGSEEELTLEGYRHCPCRTFLSFLLSVLSLGALPLVWHWRPEWRVYCRHRKSSLASADMLILQDGDGQTSVEKVVVEEVDAGFPAEYVVTSHNSDGTANGVGNGALDSTHLTHAPYRVVRLFIFHHLKYMWTIDEGFTRVRGYDCNTPISTLLTDFRGYTVQEQMHRQQLFGRNTITVEVKSYLNLLVTEVLNPFYVFQIASILLWSFDNYILYASCIFLVSCLSILLSLLETRKQSQSLHDMVEASNVSEVLILRNTLEKTTVEVEVSTTDLVPGDVVVVPPGGCVMPCDAILISGNAIVNESMLTGESVPVTKTPVTISEGNEIYSPEKHKRHTLFCGTSVIQTRYYGSAQVLAVVVRTGFSTAKGELVRSILYPRPLDFKFYKDAMKFIVFLFCIASIGMSYSIYIYIKHKESLIKTVVRTLDIVTIVVPPALPAAMTVGTYYAQSRLKKKSIFCISPPRINVSGKVKIVCFDKTGTLTEDGLEVWGVVEAEGGRMGPPVIEVDTVRFTSPLVAAMATCHSLTYLNGALTGDPLDIKMFQATKWELEEPVENDTQRFDSLIPTLVRPPPQSLLPSSLPLQVPHASCPSTPAPSSVSFSVPSLLVPPPPSLSSFIAPSTMFTCHSSSSRPQSSIDAMSCLSSSADTWSFVKSSSIPSQSLTSVDTNSSAPSTASDADVRFSHSSLTSGSLGANNPLYMNAQRASHTPSFPEASLTAVTSHNASQSVPATRTLHHIPALSASHNMPAPTATSSIPASSISSNIPSLSITVDIPPASTSEATHSITSLSTSTLTNLSDPSYPNTSVNIHSMSVPPHSFPVPSTSAPQHASNPSYSNLSTPIPSLGFPNPSTSAPQHTSNPSYSNVPAPIPSPTTSNTYSNLPTPIPSPSNSAPQHPHPPLGVGGTTTVSGGGGGGTDTSDTALGLGHTQEVGLPHQSLEEPSEGQYDQMAPTVVKPTNREVYVDPPNIADVAETPLEMPYEIGIVRQFPFSSSSQRMSVVVRVLGQPHMELYAKGAPEVIMNLCLPDTLPENLLSVLTQYTLQGFREIALAHRVLKTKLSWHAAQRLPRDQVECELRFLGLLVLQNTLKPETSPVIRQLNRAKIRTVMVTGDNILTAISVARDCGMVGVSDHVLVANASPPTHSQPASLTFEPADAPDIDIQPTQEVNIAIDPGNSEDHRCHLAVSGKAWSVIIHHFPGLVSRVAAQGTVFARMSPDQKAHLVEELQAIDYIVAMCGDGANDCGALKTAHVGISLSEAEASVAAPFTSHTPNIECVPQVICEGRCALTTNFSVFKYMALYSIIQFISVLILYSAYSNLSDPQFLYIDLFIVTVVAIFMGYSGPSKELVSRKPLGNLLGAVNMFSVLSQITLVMLFQVVAYLFLQRQPWFVANQPTGENQEDNVVSWETTTIFYVSTFQYLTLCITYSPGKPFRKPLYTNVWLTAALIVLSMCTLLLVMFPWPWLMNLMKLMYEPDNTYLMFRLTILLIVAMHFVAAVSTESLVAGSIWLKKCFQWVLCKRGPKNKYKLVLREMEDDPDWPPVGVTLHGEDPAT